MRPLFLARTFAARRRLSFFCAHASTNRESLVATRRQYVGESLTDHAPAVLHSHTSNGRASRAGQRLEPLLGRRLFLTRLVKHDSHKHGQPFEHQDVFLDVIPNPPQRAPLGAHCFSATSCPEMSVALFSSFVHAAHFAAPHRKVPETCFPAA